MARLGTKRVSDVIDYERDIRGKGLIKLTAGVGSGKNYWVGKLPTQIKNMRMLLITSRRNTADAEALTTNADQRIHISELVDDWELHRYTECGEQLFTHIVCTNSYIEYFLKNIYDLRDDRTHLWDKFDLIVIDEAHSLTTDATFSDAPFYVEQLIRTTRKLNKNCDIILMSGTPDPIRWLLEGEDPLEYVDIDIYDECVHLTPDEVVLIESQYVVAHIAKIINAGYRIVYFGTHKKNLADMINRLHKLGVPYRSMGISFNPSEQKDKLFPQELIDSRDYLREYLVFKQTLPPNVRIFFTTSKNKEGINILDDDIKYMFCETHEKADLIQMAGRVRGNSQTGTGLQRLYIIADAEQHDSNFDATIKKINDEVSKHINDWVHETKVMFEENNWRYNVAPSVDFVNSNFRYIKYDYVWRKFKGYRGRKEGEHLQKRDIRRFKRFWEQRDDVIYPSVENGVEILHTGLSMLKKDWFPDSEWYWIQGEAETALENAKLSLDQFLTDNNLINMPLSKDQVDSVRQKLETLSVVYGRKELGISDRTKMKSLNPILNKFMYEIRSQSHSAKACKIITPIAG